MSEDQQYQYETIVRNYGGRFYFVETGTALGETAEWASQKFDAVFTIEYADDLYRAALERFFFEECVTVMHGDSADLIALVMHNLDGPAVFWLDAHYDGGSAGLAPSGETPILAELETILRYPQDHVILIDDARLFVGESTRPPRKGKYPSLKYIEQLAWHAQWGGYQMIVVDDVIELTRTEAHFETAI